MGYTILYDSVGIRLPKSNLFLTLCKSGCNNLYEASGNGNKRVRDWSFWSPLGHKPYPIQTLIDKLNSWREDAIAKNKEDLVNYDNWSTYNDASFGYYTSVAKYGKTCGTTSFKQVYNHYIHKHYIDFDDFVSVYGVFVELPYYCIPDKLRDSVEPERVYVKTEEELLKTIEDFTCKYVGMQFYINANIGSWTTSKDIYRRVAPKLLEERTKVKKVKELKEVDEFWTIKFGDNFFARKTKYKIFYSYYYPQLKFASEKLAKAKLKRICNVDDRFSVACIKGNAQIYV